MSDNAATPESGAEFDAYAGDYDAALGKWVTLTGENKEFYARARIAWLYRCLHQHGKRPENVLDFGCGTGTATPFLLQLLGARMLTGVDVSEQSLITARHSHASERTQFLRNDALQPAGQFDLVYCNGVFHHIPPRERAATFDYVYRALRPGGIFALWENNPWNPLGRLAMSLAEIDRNAVPIAAPETQRHLRAAGFAVLDTNFLFIFPRLLARLRPIEHLLTQVPLGAQYQVLACRPE